MLSVRTALITNFPVRELHGLTPPTLLKPASDHNPELLSDR